MNIFTDRTSFSFLLILFLAFVLTENALAQTTDTYYPSRFSWEQKTPDEVNMDAQAVQAAIDYAKANESNNPRDLNIHLNYRGAL